MLVSRVPCGGVRCALAEILSGVLREGALERGMDFLMIDGIGYLPEYKRTGVTDALHEAFGFQTDTEIVTSKTMKNIIRSTKKQKQYDIS